MIIVAEEVKKKLQIDMIRSLISADTQSIDKNILENLFQILLMMCNI